VTIDVVEIRGPRSGWQRLLSAAAVAAADS
jgi:hypothetical protein